MVSWALRVERLCGVRRNLQLTTASQDGVGGAPKSRGERVVGFGAEESLLLLCPRLRDGAVVKQAHAYPAMADGLQCAPSAARRFFRWQSPDELVFFRGPRTIARLHAGDAECAAGVLDREDGMSGACGYLGVRQLAQ